eukprot:365744-Chlamydomonas_euryale.AAC.3
METHVCDVHTFPGWPTWPGPTNGPRATLGHHHFAGHSTQLCLVKVWHVAACCSVLDGLLLTLQFFVLCPVPDVLVQVESQEKLWQHVSEVDAMLHALRSTQQYLYWRERQHREMLHAMNSKVLWYALTRSAALVAVSTAQWAGTAADETRCDQTLSSRFQASGTSSRITASGARLKR